MFVAFLLLELLWLEIIFLNWNNSYRLFREIGLHDGLCVVLFCLLLVNKQLKVKSASSLQIKTVPLRPIWKNTDWLCFNRLKCNLQQ